MCIFILYLFIYIISKIIKLFVGRLFCLCFVFKTRMIVKSSLRATNILSQIRLGKFDVRGASSRISSGRTGNERWIRRALAGNEIGYD